jgi:hypothetical protein
LHAEHFALKIHSKSPVLAKLLQKQVFGNTFAKTCASHTYFDSISAVFGLFRCPKPPFNAVLHAAHFALKIHSKSPVLDELSHKQIFRQHVPLTSEVLAVFPLYLGRFWIIPLSEATVPRRFAR